ncbi:hypothetical protein F4820DRAFT_454420 [Hypoxylon rubiginosum]|uniref:Uncharacterized protein n=1 Tax=Hypoxylon rubiginosum TaxID=110542 RepID=A0ACB9YHJ4_9PEZI|nr:hypothetical protein F4820DRAFT_454420 [Hypoxylon rubiginosum]
METSNTGGRGRSGHSDSHLPRYPTFQNRGHLQLHFTQQVQKAEAGIRTVVSREYGIQKDNMILELSLRPVDFNPETELWRRGLGFYHSLSVPLILIPTLFIYIPDTTTTPDQTPQQREEELQRHIDARCMTFKLFEGSIQYHPDEELPDIPFDCECDLFHCNVGIQWAGEGKYVLDYETSSYIYLPLPSKQYERYELRDTDHKQLMHWHEKWETALKLPIGDIGRKLAT